MPETQTALGVEVLVARRTAGPNLNWWDINDLVWPWPRRYKTEDEYISACNSRFIETKSGALKRLLEACGGLGTQNLSTLTGLKLNLQAVTASPEDPSKFLQHGNIRVGTKTTSLKDLVREKRSCSKTTENALSCHDAGCVAYQKQIMKLLASHGDTVIDVSRTWNTKDSAKYSLSKEEMKVHTFLDNNKNVIQGLTICSGYVTGKKDHAVHAEILAGILFEAANVYRGISDLHENQRKPAEVYVTLYNSLQAAIRAKAGHALPQQEWRNLVLVFFSNVDLSKFEVTDEYREFWLGTPHAHTKDF